jgi:hypothetical protein
MRSIRIQWIRRTLRCFGGYSGEDVLPFPPPKLFSYQAYDLAEGKAMGVVEVWEKPGGNVVIDQHDE